MGSEVCLATGMSSFDRKNTARDGKLQEMDGDEKRPALGRRRVHEAGPPFCFYCTSIDTASALAVGPTDAAPLAMRDNAPVAALIAYVSTAPSAWLTTCTNRPL